MSQGRLVCSVPTASADGRFYTRYPSGNALSTPLVGNAGIVVAGAANPNRLVGAAVANVSAAAAFPVFVANFAATQNPISAGGIWANGAAVGIDWNNCQTISGVCYGSQDTLSPRYADDQAMLTTSAFTLAPAQFAQATYFLSPGYVGGGGSHECELYLRQSITAHLSTGYECSIGITTTGDAPPLGVYAFIVRWNGAAGQFTTLWSPAEGVGSYTNTPTFPKTGDTWRAQISASNVITVLQNNIVIGSVTDNTYATGQAGLGFWPVDGASKTGAGWSAWQCGNS